MPIFEKDGKKYNVQEKHIEQFATEHPEATSIFEQDGKRYRVKAMDYGHFSGQKSTPFEYDNSVAPEEELMPKIEETPKEEKPKVRTQMTYSSPHFNPISYTSSTEKVKEQPAQEFGIHEKIPTIAEATQGLMDQGVRQMRERQALREQLSEMIPSVQKERDRRGAELDEIARQNPNSFVARGTAGSIAGFDAGRMYDAEYRDYAAANEALDTAQKIINAADKEAEDIAKGDTGVGGFVKGAGRGAKDAAFDWNTWSMGFKDTSEGHALLKALDAAEDGTLTPSQQALLDAKAIELATAHAYESQLGRGYKAGKGVTESLPFMMEFAFNPIAGAGKTAANRMARYALNRFGKEAVKKNAGKYLATQAATRVGTDLLKAGAMAATTGAGRTTADALRRMQGDIYYQPNEEGKVEYWKRENAKGAGEAFKKAYLNTTLENFSEFLGNYFAPIGKASSEGLVKGLNKIGLSKVNDFIDNVKASDIAKLVSDFENKAQWNGTIGEFAEEVSNGILNSIFVGDQTLDTDENTGVFNRDNLIDTYIQTSLIGGSVSAAKTIGYPIAKYNEKRNYEREKANFEEHFGTTDQPTFYWDGKEIPMGEALASSDARIVGGALRDIVGNKDYPIEHQMTALKYAGAAKKYNGAEVMTEKRKADPETPIEQVAVEESYEQGRNISTPEAKNEAKINLEVVAKEFRNVFGLDAVSDENQGDTEDIDSYLDEQSKGDLYSYIRQTWDGNPDDGQLILDYLNKKAEKDGLYDRINDDIDRQVEQSNRIIDSRKSNDDGMIHPATLSVNDRKVYIISGNVARRDDGAIDTTNSTKDGIIVMDAETGKTEFVDAKDFREVADAIDAEQEKATAAEVIANTIAEREEKEIDGALAFAPNDTYTILDNEGAEHNIVVVGDNGDGTINAIVDGNEKPQVMAKADVQSMSDNAKKARKTAEIEVKRSSNKVVESSRNEVVTEPTANVEQAPERVVPKLQNGQPDFNAMDADMFVQEYATRYGEESTAKLARKNISSAREDIAKIDKKIDDNTDPNQMQGLFDKKAEAEARLNRYVDILDRMGMSEDANETEAGQKSKLRNEEGNKIVSLFPDGLPNVESFILADIATGNRIRWSNKETNGAVTSRGLGAELGLSDSNSERVKRLALISNEAMTPEEYAESLRERLDAAGIRYDESSLRDDVLNVYQSVDTRKGAWEALENIANRANEQEQELMDWENAQARLAYERSKEQVDMPELPDLATYEEQTPVEFDNNYNEVETIFNEETNERITEDSDVSPSVYTEDRIPDGVAPSVEMVQGEQVADTIGDRRSTEARQGSNEGDERVRAETISSTDVYRGAEVDKQGNPINLDGSLKLEKVESIDDMTDEDFENPYRNIELPTLPENVADAIGSKGKSVVIKKNIFERNIIRHSDLTPDQSRDILKSALYSPNLYGQNQKKRKPYNWVVVSTKDANGQNKLVLLEISDRKNNIEIVHWHYVDARGLEKLKRQAEREDGQLLILPSEATEEVGALSDPTLSMSSDNKDNAEVVTKQENVQENVAEEQKNVAEQVAEPSAEDTASLAETALPKREEMRRKPLRERAKMWEEKVGVKVNLIESYEDIPTDAAERAVEKGQRVTGWMVNGEVYLYMPNIANRTEIDKTYLHEVVAHKGVKNLLGAEKHKEFCQRVWDEVMTDADKKKYSNYLGVDSKVKAADEFIAHLAETTDMNASVWQKIARVFRDILRKMGIDIHLTNADIEAMLRDSYKNLTNEENVADIDEELVQFRFIGEKGATNLDKAEEATTRIDNLAIAREMEEAGKSAKSIKMATGWERGADNKWRYEVDDIELQFEPIRIINGLRNGNEYRLEQVLTDDSMEQLVAEYPEFMYIKLSYDGNKQNAAGYWRGSDLRIVLTPYTKVSNLREIITHEIQHVIQDAEGFARGSNAQYFVRKDLTAYKDEMANVVDYGDADVAYELYSIREAAERLVSEGKYNYLRNAIKYVAREYVTNGFLNAKVYGFLEIEQNTPAKDVATYIANVVSDGSLEQWRELPYDMRNSKAGAMDKYMRTAGEVEARNVSTRMDMTAEERRALLAEDTEDVAREDQIFLEDALGENSTQFRVVDPAPTFYSNAENAVKNIKQEKATPEQWLKMIEKNGGLKAGEDKWLGLSDWLKASDKKTLTKQEVLDFIKENQIQIEEVQYGDGIFSRNSKINLESELQAALENGRTIESALSRWDNEFGDNKLALYERGFFTVDEKGKIHTDEPVLNHINSTRLNYTTYGLDNKREIALVVPTIESWNASDQVHFGDAGNGRAIAWVRFGETTVPVTKVKEVKAFNEPRKSEMTGRDVYAPIGTKNSKDYVVYGKMRTGEMAYVVFIGENPVSKHNTLEEARLAMNEYYKEHKHYVPAGQERVLVIDEIQSKRHQEGREKGYQDSKRIKETTQRFNTLADEKVALVKEILHENGFAHYTDEDNSLFTEKAQRDAEMGNMGSEEQRKKILDISLAMMEAAKEMNALSGIPEAPFEKNWAELAMKRMLRYAAENGFDKVAWTTGEQQAERYDLSKSIDRIVAEDNTIEEASDGTPMAKEITLTTAGGMDIRLSVDANGVVRGREYDGKKLSDVVGKPLADKLMQKGDMDISGDGLKVGGEGMKGFYDQMLPSFMNKYGKKWGVKVGEVTMPNLEENNTMHSVDVTDAMRESVMQGQPMFRVTPQEDARYLELVESGNLEEAQKMVNAVANASGYNNDTSWRKSHTAPHKSEDDVNPFNTEELVPADYWTHPEWYTSIRHNVADRESYYNMGSAINKYKRLVAEGKQDEADKVTVTMYRGIDKTANTKESTFRNGDWITPSRTYAKMSAPYGKSRIITEEVPLKNIWWDGNSINEWGYDDGASYVYKDTKNNRKLADAVTYDDNGNVIPLSQRFNSRNADVRFRVTDYDNQFAELQSEYDALDKNDAKALNEWREKKKGVTLSYMKAISDNLNYPIKDFRVIASEEDMRNFYEEVVKFFNEEMDYKKFAQMIMKPEAFYMKDMEIIGCHTDRFPNVERKAYVKLLHEQTHCVNGRLFSDEQLADVWGEAVRNDKIENTEGIARNYGDNPSNNGDEYLAYTAQRYAHHNIREDFESYIKGEDGVSLDTFMRSANKSLPLRNQALIEILKYYRNGYNKRRHSRNVEESHKGFRSGNGENQRDIRTERGGIRGGVLESANALAASLGVKLNVVDAIPNAPKGVKGRYSISTDHVYFVLPNATSVEDAKRTVLHEVVAHKGLRDVVGRERFNKFLDKVFQATTLDVRSKIIELAKNNSWNVRVATEEYLASLAEKGFDGRENRTFWEKVRDLFMDMLREAKIILGFNINDNDMLYMLWRTYQMQKSQGIMAVAEDVVMQRKLGVGRFRFQDTNSLFRVTPNDDIRYRVAPSTPSTGVAREEYDKAVRIKDKDNNVKKTENLWHHFREGYQDSMLSVKKLMDAVLKETGNKLRGSDDVYTAENHLSSKNKAEIEKWERDFMKPLQQEIFNLINKGASYDDIVEYLLAKHGLERNGIFAIRDAQDITEKWEKRRLDGAKRAFDYEKNKIIRSFAGKKAYLSKSLGTGAITQDDYDKQIASLEKQEDRKLASLENKYNRLVMKIQGDKSDTFGRVWNKIRGKDFSGLTELTGEAKHFTEAAQQIVEEFEGKYNTANLWSKINAATKEALRKSYESSLMNKETYDKVSKMFKYYIPLRGWDSNVASDEYEYMANKGMKILPALKTAKGRTSRADDPIATLGSMGESSIIQGNRNQMKLKFLNFALSNPTSLLTVSEQWYEQNADGTWKPKNPEIPTNATADEVDAIIKAHEAKMKALGDKATKKRQGLNLNLHTTRFEQEEHAVNVKRNGKEYKIFVNGNPIAAQAINGFTNPNANKKDSWEWIEQRATAVRNFMARAFTSMNPAFIFTNLARDLVWAGTSVAIKENASYTRLYSKNISKAMTTAQLPRLVSKWKKGTLDMNNPIEKYFHEFVTNGGETGFTQLNTVDDYKRNMERFIKEAQGGTTTNIKKAWRWVGNNVEFLNRSSEDTTRFMVYLTSRQMGRSITESVSNAKDITVNFNKKGRGTMGANVLGFAYIFFNATIQSLANFGKLIANHPKKTAAALTTFGALGMIAPMTALALQAMLSGDDDEPTYWDLPEWVRRNNIVIYVGGSGYVTIPLPHELRPFYGMGELALSVLMGKEEPDDALKKAVAGFASLMPLDFTGNGGNVAVNFTPTIAQPVAQLIANKDYFGVPIYRRTDYNKLNPGWTKAYKSTNRLLVDATEWLNEATGGDKYKRGIININPAIVEHLFEGYFGGMAKTINRTAKTFSMLWDEDAREWRNVPILSSFYQKSDDRTSGSQVNREYFDAIHEHDILGSQYSGYKKEANMGSMEYAKKLQELINSDAFKRYQTVHSYKLAVDKLNRQLKTADPTDSEDIDNRIMQLKVDMLEELDELNNK